MGLLLALYEAGYAGPLLVERQQDLSAQVRQLIMLSPAQAWSVSRVAKMLFLGESTLRRRLRQESQSFRQIVEEVRMAHALGQLQDRLWPIADPQEQRISVGIALYRALPSALWFTAEACTLSEFAILQRIA